MQKISKIMLPLTAVAALPACTEKPMPLEEQPVLPEDPKEMNVLFITMSDIGYYDFGYTGSDFYETPVIDRLANGGMQFSSAYSCAANSSPSRASMITGMFTPRFGIYSTDFTGTEAYMRLAQAKPNKTLPASSYTLAEAFRDMGYRTITVGDWDPLDSSYQGYDLISDFGGSGSGSSEPISDDPKWLMAETNKMCEFMDQAVSEGKPFFGALSYHAIHTPIQCTQASYDYFSAKTPGSRHSRVDYAALIKDMDNAMGCLMDHLREKDLEDNTIIVLTSDHGAVFYSTQAPNRGFKGMVYEGGIRIPLVFYNPKLIPAGVCSMPVAGVDLFPTMLELAGGNSPECDGISLTEYVKGQVAPVQRPEPMYWHMPGYLAIGNYKNAGARDERFRQRPCSVVRDGDWKLILYYEEWLLDGGWEARQTNRSIELFNLRTDISETHNCANEEPELRDRLIKQLLKWVEDTNAPIPTKKEGSGGIEYSDAAVTFPVSWPLGNGLCTATKMPHWESEGYWACPSQPSAYLQFSWGERPEYEKANNITPTLSITNSGEISSPSCKYLWTGDTFEFVLPVENFAAGTTITMKFPFYGRQQPIFWNISYLDGEEWKCNRRTLTSYDGSASMDCTLALVRGGKVIEEAMNFEHAVEKGHLKFRLQCADGRYQAATASAIAVREAPNVELGGDTVCYFYCSGSGVSSIEFSAQK